MIIRRAKLDDAELITGLIRETIKKVNSRDYSDEQISAWVANNTADKMNEFILGKRIIWVVFEGDELRGVGIFNQAIGEIGALYVKHDRLEEGIGGMLYSVIEDYARNEGYKELILCSTITALNFYKKQGYVRIKETNVEMNDVKIPCIKMKKKLQF